MSPIVLIAIILTLITALMGILIARKLRRAEREHGIKKELRIWVAVLIATGIACGFLVVGASFVYTFLVYKYDQCVSSVVSRNNFRQTKLDDFRDKQYSYDFFDALAKTPITSTVILPGQPSLRDALAKQRAELDQKFPEKFLTQCPPRGTK